MVDVAVKGSPSVVFAVVNWADGVQVVDPNREDLSVEQGLDYLAYRAAGVAPRAALNLVRETR
ncbi:hypothetical protein [Jatrophihabitans sp. GAS493]|uniref:hypothetical protein n=1 Tax=Jatrophihabitans sp. GAS493 TaxID=1907575 RepID=UPI0012FD6831|nr:hypothetical protein [Jatrophihabitans sp. GAS493]